ncbi:hypothetical protein GCM10023318_45490 [Nocardia callitridis]|uniref:Type VII secretion system protein EccE domain-containing protein n=1 Tax=Nocardia callitridis TaxID=648753 RepID=A0ABP9KRU5_9NOCA
MLVRLFTHAPWWVGAVVLVGLVVMVTVRVAGRTAARWLIDWAEYRFGHEARARERTKPARLVDVQVAAGVCGVHEAGTTVVAMIQLAPDLDLPTVIADHTLYTEDTIPVRMLLPMLDQFGIHVDIDIVTTGQRVRQTGSYSMLYDQLIGTHPVVGERLTWLVVRLDQERNLHTLSKRGLCAEVAPKAVASAAHRIAGRLRERGIAAHVLPASALRDATRQLHAGVELTDLRETWSCLESSVPGRTVTSFLIDWDKLDGAELDDCWSWNRGRTTMVVSLTSSAVGPRALVRFVGPPVSDSLPAYLRTLNGGQSQALLASLPASVTTHALRPDAGTADVAAEEFAADLAVSIGPNGQILGAISGQPRHTLALPLFDPVRYNPRHRTIDVQAKLPVVQQILLRAMVVGAEVEIHSSRPNNWRQLVAAVGDPRSLRLAAEPTPTEGADGGADYESAATIAVFDRVPPRGSQAHTTLTISEPGSTRRRAADLSISQVGAAAIDVGIPMRTVRVDLIEPRGETRYFDAVEEQPAIGAGPSEASAPVAVGQPGGRRVS